MLRLPPELLRKIFADFTLERHELMATCCVCHMFNDVAGSLLYENVALTQLGVRISAMDHPLLAPKSTRHRLIRRLAFSTIDVDQCAPFQSLLRLAHQLQELYLQWPYITRKNDQPLNLYTLTGAVDCPFRLTKFHWDCRFLVLFDLDGLAEFLEHQPSIEVLMLPSIQSSVKLSEQALPRLRVLWTTVVFAASVLPKRPVTHLRLEDIYSISFTQRTAISSDMISKLELLDLSSYFTLPSSVPPFAAGMVNLESLRILIKMGDQEIRMLGDLPLHKLRRIHFSAWGDSQLGVNPAIILALFKSIPSLECVIAELPYDRGKPTLWDYFYKTGASVRKKKSVPRLQAPFFKDLYWIDEWWRDSEDDFEATEEGDEHGTEL